MKSKYVKLDADALRRGGASAVLCLDPSTIGGLVRLRAEAPADFETVRLGALDEGGGAGQSAPVVAVVRVEGPLAQKATADLCGYVDGYDAIAARFELAAEHADVTSVLMVIDSPGGDVAGLESAVGRMQRAKKKSGKRVIAYVDEMAASAAYWIAATVADEVVIPAAGHVGSIGVIAAFVDVSAALEAAGEKWTVIREPAGKAASSPMAPVADVAVERMTAEVKAVGARFFKAISTARDIPTKTIRGLNGAVLSGKAAIEAGLADHIDTLEGALARTRKPSAKSAQKTRAEGNDMRLIAAIAASLGLGAEASETDAIEAFEAFDKQMQAATGAPTLRKAVASVDSLKIERDAFAEKAGEVAGLELKLAAAEAVTKAAAIDAVVLAGVEARKITPAKRAEFSAKAHKNGAEWAASVIEELPVIVGAEPPPRAASTGPAVDANGLTPAEIAICAETGCEPATFAMLKARNARAATPTV